MKIVNHLLADAGPGYSFRRTPNFGGQIKPSLIVIHYTGAASAAGAVNWLCNPVAKASAHLVIAEDGTITQLAPFNVKTWHAGISSWGKKSNCNDFAIGIELANPGQLQEVASGKFVTRLERKPVPAERVTIARHKNGGGKVPWALFDPRQIAAAEDVSRQLVASYGIKEIVGHDDIAPGRKTDPGPAFPMAAFTSRVFGRQ